MSHVGTECAGLVALAMALWLLPTTQRPLLLTASRRARSLPRVQRSDDPWAEAMVLDLLAACSTAGMPLAAAAAAVAKAAPEPLSTSLRRGAEALVLGGDPGTVWEGSAGATAGLSGLARRSLRCGSSLSGRLTELAAQRRESARDRMLARAERVGVFIAGPLGLCFLPAFLCLGVLPVVIGLAGTVLGDQLPAP